MTDTDIRKVIADFGSCRRARQARRLRRHPFAFGQRLSAGAVQLAARQSPRRSLGRRCATAHAVHSRRLSAPCARRPAPDFPITARLGLADAVENGLAVEDGLAIARQLAARGLAALEVTYGVMTSYRENIRPYAGTTRWRAIADGMLHRTFSASGRRSLLPAVCPRRQVGDRHSGHPGRRPALDGRDGRCQSAPVMRTFWPWRGPFVREPDLVNKIAARPPRPGRLRLLQHLFSA